jgi:hypothetical protein
MSEEIELEQEEEYEYEGEDDVEEEEELVDEEEEDITHQSAEDALIWEIKNNRYQLAGMLDTIKTLREQTTKLLPDKLDSRGSVNRFVLEQRMKAMSEVMNMELGVRKEVNNSIKLEVDLSRKLWGADDKETDKSERINEIYEVLNIEKPKKK